MRMFSVEFSGAAEGLGHNEAALKDLFNSALDGALSWWRMRGQDHLTFGEFVESLARSPAKVAGVPQVVDDEAAAPPVAALEPAPFCEPIESTPEPAPFREPTEFAPESALVREPTEPAPEPA